MDRLIDGWVASKQSIMYTEIRDKTSSATTAAAAQVATTPTAFEAYSLARTSKETFHPFDIESMERKLKRVVIGIVPYWLRHAWIDVVAL